jgi:putative ABC transport system substrate-binding protein
MERTFWVRVLNSSFENLKSKSQNRKWAGLFTIVMTCVGLAGAVDAQQPTKIPRIGYVSGSGNLNIPGLQVEAFRQGLRDLGYVEGKNIVIEFRYIEGLSDRTPSLVAELVQLKVDVVVVTNPPAVLAAKQATKSIPIVIVTTEDPVTTGIIDSLARPGGNITGLSILTKELSGKRLELLKEAVPGISRVGVLWSAVSGRRTNFEYYEAAAHLLKIPLQSIQVRGPNPDFEEAFQVAAKGRVSALVTVRTAQLSPYQNRIADLAIKNRLPSMLEGSAWVEAGGLMSYSANEADQFRRAAYFVDKILKGAKPADLPVEQPMKFELVINLKTAKQIGLTIPPNVLARADRVIK